MGTECGPVVGRHWRPSMKPDRFFTPIAYDNANCEYIEGWPGPTGLSEFLLEERRKNAQPGEPPVVSIMGIAVTGLYFPGGWMWTTVAGWMEPLPKEGPQ